MERHIKRKIRFRGICVELIKRVILEEISRAGNDRKENCDTLAIQDDNKVVEVVIWRALS
jgi:hypothetical protein